jgi:glycosyltransferase involved in cell wall biosynthesis
LVPVKRADIFIRTIHLLNIQGYTCKGVIIGSGFLEKDLKLLAKKLSISELIEFRGFINPAALEMSKLDALIMPSDHEGLPMSLIEAVALGVPVIAHNVGGIPEVIKGWQYGTVVDDHSPEGYSQAVISIFDILEKSDGRFDSEDAEVHPPGFTNLFTSVAGAKLYQKLYKEVLLPPSEISNY